jgi:trans-aconitate methyltransferase
VTTEAVFYDDAMTGEDAPAMLPLELSPWLPLYEEAVRWVHPAHAVVDLGCGTGRFLSLLVRRGHYGPMRGHDFSAEALLEARAYLETEAEDVQAEFVQGDLRDWQPATHRPGNTSYVCLEVLEHLEDDRELIARIPPGHQLIFSVPNYESEAHLRVFRNAGDVFRRYEGWLAIRRWSLIALGGGKAIHLCDSRRRIGSW